MPPANQKNQEFPLTFEGGLVTEVEDSTLEVGQAASLVNWVPTAQGGLRARNAWSAISTNGIPLEIDYKVRGWGIHAQEAGAGFTFPAVVQTNETEQALAGTISVSLTGVTVGNLLIGVAFTNSTASDVTSTWTNRDANLNSQRYSVFTHTATGSNETFTANCADVTSLYHAVILEVSGTASETPTDTDDAGGLAGTATLTRSCDSPATVGFALAVWYTTNDWSTAPAGSGYTLYQSSVDFTGSFDSYVYGKTYTSSPVTTEAAADSGFAAYGGLFIWDGASAAATPANFYIVVAVATDTGYSLYRIPREDISTGTWELIDSATCADTDAFVSISVGAGTLVWSSQTMDVPRSVNLTTLVAADVTDLNGLAGRTVCYHKDRMFVGGSTDEPSRMYFSDIGDPTTFTTATDFLDVGGDDGEAIEDLVSVEGLLLVCKVNRLYLISGSGIETFITNELPGGSAATGRPAIRTPYGTVVVGPADIWVVQGGGVDPMSRSLGEGFSITGLVSTAYAQDMVLICDSGTGNLYRVNLVTGAWQLEEVTEGENEPGHLFSLQGRLYYGVINSTTELGGTRRLSSARDYDFTGGTNYEASTGKLALLGPSVTYTPRWLYLQLRNQDTTLPNSLFVTITTDINEDDPELQGIMVTDAVQRKRIDLGRYRGAAWLQIGYRAASSAIAGAIDIEKSVLGVMVDGGH